MAENVTIKQNVSRSPGATVIGVQHNNYIGLSDSEVTDLIKRTEKETIKKFIKPDDFLMLKFAAHSMAPLLHKYCIFPLQIGNGKQYILKFEKEENKGDCPYFKCSINDTDENNINLYTQFGQLGILPQSIYKYLHFRDKGCTEVTITSHQIVAGKAKDGSIILASVEPGYPSYCLPIKVALYVPFEVTP